MNHDPADEAAVAAAVRRKLGEDASDGAGRGGEAGGTGGGDGREPPVRPGLAEIARHVIGCGCRCLEKRGSQCLRMTMTWRASSTHSMFSG